MTPERWEEIKQKILSGFEVTRHDLEKDDERRETAEIIEFDGPLGQMKVAWISRPKVLDKKTQYSNRIGSSVKVDYVYSPDEVTHTFKVYNWSEPTAAWQEMKRDLNI
ncbi:MAG: hypothetical protein A2927_00210 [Candidatus Komeilibacteria bacterium RIFCSPLOWO2_01_FULL_45_10]|uniref:Uncharacterized protein n=1 Tax=Candidatus Komeilibacteria bacterium RIFCSPLOWO2_01_FULL_45_10 TaxID=1798550 RepID=A0A1G2BNY4_9BACT|nr:MAG: hypothetical protein A2927_00210 [Candidatus Komeilibacteria bacterium RIFCSPLOWO2_01_FULL_45_10]